ncbi:alpha/beta fold hydrolase [Planctomonas psychrotolerans]|uniref:alpha/beta fold hydrolase n=1 Tax=Planctomonas psychrotolerans TaxID=2528712 RepID=UPI001D0D589C|nr:alpha/beta fold hydrolase [Planctomonas psychrotolerans]
MPHLDVPGGSLYYEVDGHASAPALLLIHAGVATLRMWDPVVPSLAGDHLVIRFDTRGFGGTTTDDVDFTNRGDARALLDHLGIAEVTVIGSSRGGQIAIDLTVETPERVRGLVTIGSGPSGFHEIELTEEEDAAIDAIDAAYQAADWERLAELEVRLWSIGPSRTEADLDPDFVRTAYELNRANIRHATERPTLVPLEPPAYDRVVDIGVPTLVTVGAHDLTSALVRFEYLAATIPGADVARFPNSAHLPSVEEPALFAATLREWLGVHGL